jgi:hypothetical protein
MVLCLPIAHRLAGETAVSLAALDGERLLVPSAVGTPYTDLLIARLDEAGATVVAVEARVTGGGAILRDLVATGTVAIMPRGTSVPADVTSVAIADAMTLPLFVLWAGARPSPAARQLTRLMPGN